MKILLSWLKEYIDINLPPAQIGKILTSLGLEVDAIENVGTPFARIIVAKIINAAPHPAAEKLQIATVFDGSREFQVVCGAPNCRMGIKTAFAPVGAVLRDKEGKENLIQNVKIRGIESFGMLCSPFELGLSSDHSGILEFADHIKEGSDVAEMYRDVVFEVSLTPNLSHCQSLIGVARELSAATGLPVKYPSANVQEDEWDDINKAVSVSIQDSEKCPRYTCRLIRNVKISPSPAWLKNKLERSGLRSVNNVVDVTNYVLLELGHPLHAFDYDTLSGHQIIVKTAEPDEGFMTLDNKKRVLSNEDLVISDQNKSVAIAGVMGGLISEVTPSTVNVLLESAYFQPATIRKTSKKFGLQTDASKRFERGTDPNGVILSLERAAMLIQQLADGKVARGIIDQKEKDFQEIEIQCRLNRINNLLGTQLSINEVENIFNRLGFHPQWNKKDAFMVKIPTYRVDIQTEIDLIEETARLYGYDKIPKVLARYQGTMQPDAPIFLFERQARQKLLNQGLQEFLTCDLIGPTLLDIIQEESVLRDSMIKVLNPTSVEQSVLRTSLLPGLLQVVKFNIDHQNHSISGFELGRIHFKDGDQYKEQSMAAIILTGKARAAHWDRKAEDVDFYDLKGMVEAVFNELGIEGLEFKSQSLKIFHNGRQASIYVGSLEVGSLGEVHPSIQRRLDVSQRILFAEFNLHDLFKIRKPLQKMAEIPIYPHSTRDWTITLPEDLPIETILKILRSISSPLLEEISVKDIFKSEKIGKDKKNATFHFVYRDRAKTIEFETVEEEHDRIIKEALKSL